MLAGSIKSSHWTGKQKVTTTDRATVERIVEIITREVMIALAEQEAHGHAGDHCSETCSEGLCIQTCQDRVGRVVSAGATRLTASLGVVPPEKRIAAMIDHTLLKPDATHDQIAQLCFEARKYGFASVCVNPSHVRLCSDLLKNSSVLVCTVIGFPLGAGATDTKVFEASKAIDDGAQEIDMVINIGALKSRDYDYVAKDINAVVQAAHPRGVIVKVILETALLNREEKIAASLISKEAGADFVKTSTGFGGGGATVEDVALMRQVVGPEMGVKASGGVGSLEDALHMVEAGATRIGASAGVKIVSGGTSKGGY